MARRKSSGSSGEVDMNMTPMIDVTFQLIIFFILASQFASAALAQLQLFRPHESQAQPAKDIESPNKVIINVVSRGQGEEEADPIMAGRAKEYVIGGNKVPPQETGRIKTMIEEQLNKSPAPDEFYVEIRADYRVEFGSVRPVMEAAAEAGVVPMRITALTAAGG